MLSVSLEEVEKLLKTNSRRAFGSNQVHTDRENLAGCSPETLKGHFVIYLSDGKILKE